MHCQAMNLAANILYPCILKLESLEKKKKNGEDLQWSIFSILFCQGCFTATARYGVTRKGSRKGYIEYSKADYKEPKEKKCLLTLDLKPFRSQIKEKHSARKKFQSQPKERNCWHTDPYNIYEWWHKHKNWPAMRMRMWNQFCQFRWTSTKYLLKRLKRLHPLQNDNFSKCII